jgi:hypothetical protein
MANVFPPRIRIPEKDSRSREYADKEGTRAVYVLQHRATAEPFIAEALFPDRNWERGPAPDSLW